MTFKEEIDLQLRDNKMLSYEILSQLKDKWKQLEQSPNKLGSIPEQEEIE